MSLFDSNYDYNPLYAGGGRNDLETDIMEAESIDDMLAQEQQAEEEYRRLMGFTEEDTEIAHLDAFGGLL